MSQPAISKDFQTRIRQAIAKGWRMDRSEAVALTDLAILHGDIDVDQGGRMVRHLEQGAIMRRDNGQWVCTTCGGNCGQCGMTDFIGNVGFSFDRIVAGLNQPGNKPVDQEARMADHRYNKNTVKIILGWLAVAAAFVFIASMLGGCTSVPPGTYVGSGTCGQCIGPYDVTLSSHREALTR